MLPGFNVYYVHEDDRDFRTLLNSVHFWLAPVVNRNFGIDDTGGLPALLVLALIRSLVALDNVALMREGTRYVSDDWLPEPLTAKPRSQFSDLLEPLGAQSLLVRPKVGLSTPEKLECNGFEVRLKFTSGAEYVDSGLTFGQRRFLMIALLLLFRPSFPAVIDEVDNGLHPRLVEAVLRLLPARQSFLASHNKLVLDYINYEDTEDIRRKIHICRRALGGDQTVAAIDEATAQEVHEKLSVGIMHVSDILRMEGLW